MRKTFHSLLLILILLFISGCSNPIKNKEITGTCIVSLEDIPEEYQLLPETLRSDIEIKITLRQVSNDKKHTLKLSEKNGYQNQKRLRPGKYFVSDCYIKSGNVVNMDIKSNAESLTVVKNETIELPIYIVDTPSFVKTIKNNEPLNEIIDMNPYSRKVQYNGQLIDLINIRSILDFTPKGSKKSLSASETLYVPSTQDPTVSIIVQNQSNDFTAVDECTLIGVEFKGNNVVFPNGISLGMDIASICHTQKGLMGTPDYFEGMPDPFIWIEQQLKNDVVYLDQESGDRIKFAFYPELVCITYEFEKFE